MIAIIAVNNIGQIGKNNKLLWHSSDDLKHFKKLCLGKVMLVGYNTYLELPEVVKKRKIVVDDRAILYNSHYPMMNENGDFDFIPYLCIGGKKTYEKYAPYFTELHISHINDNSIGDCTFPDFKDLNPECKIFNYNFETNEK